MKHVIHGRVGGGEKGGAEDGRDGKVPCLGETRDAAWDPYISRAATSRTGGELNRGQAGTRVARVRGLRGEKETEFLQLRRNGGEFRNRRA